METGKEFLEGYDPQIKEVGYENYTYTSQQVIERLDAYRKELVKESDFLPCVSEMFCVMVDSKKTLSFHKTEKGANNRVTEWEQSQFEGVFHVEKIEVEE